MGDGVRTRDIRCHRPTLYQLSYAHQRSDYRQFTLNLLGIEGAQDSRARRRVFENTDYRKST